MHLNSIANRFAERPLNRLMGLIRVTLAIVSVGMTFSTPAFAQSTPVAWSFEDTDGDGKMWLCQYSRDGEDIRGVLTVDTTGYFAIDTIDNTMFDSGDHQRNESYFLLIKNSANPDGYPIDPNCGRQFILRDQEPLPAHLGTFYLMAGEDNVVEMHHYCDLWRAGECTDMYDPGGEDAGGCHNCESVSLVLDTLEFTRKINICEEDNVPITDFDRCDGYDNDCDGNLDEDDPDCDICDATGTETCDGVDNDCNGLVDENDDCGPGFRCSAGGCRAECTENCAGGECIDGLCIPAPCGDSGEVCPEGESCLRDRCVNLCEGLSCPPGTACSAGECVDPTCYTQGCTGGTVCVNGGCQVDPCIGVSCGADEFCRAGECVGSCADVICSPGAVCVDGSCEMDPCADVECQEGQTCREGSCEADACATITCPGELICQDGACTGDPCNTIDCPAGAVCQAGQCVSPSAAGLANGGDLDSGCACQSLRSSSGGSAPSHGAIAVLLITLIGLIRIRRKRRK